MNTDVTTDPISDQPNAGAAPGSRPEDGSPRIVVGYDGSASSKLALDWAVETAQEMGARLAIVHGVSMAATTTYPAMDYAAAQPYIESAAQQLVAEGAARAGTTLETERIATQYWMGSPAGQIIEESKDADLVVVGTRGRGRVLGGLLGSTSYSVAAHAHCPVVIVRGPAGSDDDEDLPAPTHPGSGHPVIAASDGSEPSERAVDAAAAVAVRTGAPLHIIRVIQPIGPNAWVFAEGGNDLVDDRAVLAGAERSLDEVAQAVSTKHPDLEVTTQALLGDPGSVIAEQGDDAGLIAVGSRGRGGFAGMLLGSVSHRVIHEALCPVMVIR